MEPFFSLFRSTNQVNDMSSWFRDIWPNKHGKNTSLRLPAKFVFRTQQDVVNYLLRWHFCVNTTRLSEGFFTSEWSIFHFFYNYELFITKYVSNESYQVIRDVHDFCILLVFPYFIRCLRNVDLPERLNRSRDNVNQ